MNPRESWYTERREYLNKLDAEIEELIQLLPIGRPILKNYILNLNPMLRKMVLEIKTNSNILEILEGWMQDIDERITVLESKIQLKKGLDMKKIEEDVKTVKKDIKERIFPAVELIEEAKKRREKWMKDNR
ncbi:MAG: hypothetical protein NWE91_00450 [Candidatus Bathyarchaeota archaeon]|nr:hypothetical protein [Candidatus Bathyarchaeota archaeon]